jgi:hypothetical protein
MYREQKTFECTVVEINKHCGSLTGFSGMLKRVKSWVHSQSMKPLRQGQELKLAT